MKEQYKLHSRKISRQKYNDLVVVPVAPYAPLGYVDEEEKQWLEEGEGQRAWEAVRGQNVNPFDPPNWWERIVNWTDENVVQPAVNVYNQTVTGVKNFVNNTIAWTNERVVKPVVNFLGQSIRNTIIFTWELINSNAYGQDLIEISKDEILRSPEIALWKTYIATAINVQREGINFGGYESGKGPSQLSQQQLDAPYGEPYGCDDTDGNANQHECTRGYGLGMEDADPYDPNVAVEGMSKRIEQVLKFAENQFEKNDIKLDETDRFIIIALSQNGPGFDKNDVSSLLKNYVQDGTINWKGYFKYKYNDWTEKPWLERAYLEAWQWIKTGEGGKDFDTEFSLEMYYQEMRALESQGYPFPDGLDIQRIEELMNTSEQTKQEEK